jgi:dTDP-4-dehydrorhamnose reductase
VKEKLIIIGRGFLGTEIERRAKEQGYSVICTNKTNQKNSVKLDIVNSKEVEEFILKHNPKFIINCAVSGKIDYLENHQEEAFKVNTIGVKNLAMICKKKKIRIIHISTDSVFDGQKGNYSENDLPNPLNIYAKSKFLGEEELKNLGEDYIIIRTNFYGIDKRGNYFLNWILDSIKNKKIIKGFKNVIFSPVDIDTLSTIVIELLTKKYSGILHISSSEQISKFEFITKVLEFIGEDSKKIIPINYNQSLFNSTRPLNTSLNNKKSSEIIKIPIISIDQWLKNHKKEILGYIRNF